MNPDPVTSRRLWPWLVPAVGAALAWLWVCWCLFPVSVWNDVRLAPSLALARGVPLYAGEHAGAVTTWIYGPLPVLLWLPAALAPTAAQAVAIAGLINLLTTVGAIAAVCAWWPAPRGTTLSGGERALAAAAAIAIWPFAAFQYLQADNVAVALGLVANLLLVRTSSRRGRWGAAGLAVAALACKQTSVGVAAAQCVWLGATAGWGEARRHAGRCAVLGLLLGAWMAASFDWAGLRLNLFTVPGHLPWAPHPVQRVIDLAPLLVIHLLLPGVILVAGRRRIWTRESPLLLPSLAWLCAWPASAAALMKFGGTLNSLQSLGYWLPPALLLGCAMLRQRRAAIAWFAAAALAAAALCGLRLARLREIPRLPLVEHYRQAANLARLLPGEVWFPWNPLVTIYAENRFDHVEDGLLMRFLAGRPLTMDDARRHLPPRMCVIALPHGGTEWGIALHFAPPDARTDDLGLWTLHSWRPGAVDLPPSRSQHPATP